MNETIRKRKVTTAMIKNAIIPAIDTLAVLSIPFNPVALATWFVVKNLYGLYADSSMDEINDFYKEIDKKIPELSLHILSDNNFRKGLLLQTEEIIKTRNKDKIKILKGVFLNGFMTTEDKENFELEKINATIKLMSIENFIFLKKTATEILRKSEKSLQATYKIGHHFEQLETLSNLGVLLKGGLPIEKIKLLVEKSNADPKNSTVSLADYYDEEYYCISEFGNEILKYIPS